VSDNTRINGYSIRTQRIVEEQLRRGIDARIVEPKPGVGCVADVYSILETTSAAMKISATSLLQEVPVEIRRAADLLGTLRGETSDVIHAHTPWWVAVAAASHAKRLGIPWVYEVRGIQEESAVVDGSRDRHSVWFDLWSKMSSWATQSASHVFAISPELVKFAIRNGAKSVSLAPNAVDCEMFSPVDEDERSAIRAKYQIGDGPVIGYFGSIRPLEGVEELIRSIPILAESLPDVRVLIMGPGDPTRILRLADDLGVQDRIDYRGAVEPDVIPEVLPCVDCVAITRPDTFVTRTVTPLKPLEALACGVPVVSSDLEALRFVGQAGTLFYPPGDTEALAEALSRAISDRKRLGTAGRTWVQQNMSWEQLVDVHFAGYSKVGVVDD
jgi:glycosyltransferase involved in cell wall biosynthesis